MNRRLPDTDSAILFRVAQFIGHEEDGIAWAEESQRWLDAPLGEDEQMMLDWLRRHDISEPVMRWLRGINRVDVLKHLEGVSIIMDIDDSRIREMPDAVLVASYRHLRCGKGSPESTEDLIAAFEAEIERREIDLDHFRGDTGYATRRPT